MSDLLGHNLFHTRFVSQTQISCTANFCTSKISCPFLHCSLHLFKLCELTHYLFDICFYLQSEKNELDENQEGNSSGDKESSSLKQRIAQKRNVVQGKYFFALFYQWKVRGKFVSLVI